MNADGTLCQKGGICDSLNMMYMDAADGHMLTDLVERRRKEILFCFRGTPDAERHDPL